MTEAIHHDIPEIQHGKWLRDLGTALSPLSEVLRVKFLEKAGDEDEADPENYLRIGAYIREVLNPSSISKPKVVRGNTFVADIDEDTDTEEQEQGRGRKRAGTDSALKDASDSKKKKDGCKACGQTRHELSRCFYAFPEFRYKGFKPSKKMVDKVAKALEENEELVKEIEAIRQKRQKKKSQDTEE